MQNVQSALQNDVSCVSALRCLMLFLERLGSTPASMQRMAGERAPPRASQGANLRKSGLLSQLEPMSHSALPPRSLPLA